MRRDHLLLLGDIERAGVGHQQHHPGRALRMVHLHHRLNEVPVDAALSRGEHLSHRGAEDLLLHLTMDLMGERGDHQHGLLACMDVQGDHLHKLLDQGYALGVPANMVPPVVEHRLCHLHQRTVSSGVSPGVGVAGEGERLGVLQHHHHHHLAPEEGHKGHHWGGREKLA